ncbi:MAG: hypothetical protein Q4Q06_00840 [Bacteroidota bacterium]|nr:hypothetical protein [Bacteroidota bacterium]
MLFSQVKGQNGLINKMISVINRNHFPHAILISGKDGYGNLAVALSLAQYLSCTNKQTKEQLVEQTSLMADACGECPSCKKYAKLSHPDLHIFFPTSTTTKVKKDAKSSVFMAEFRDFVLSNQGYGDINDWLAFIGAETKQGIINVADADEIISLLSMKTYESQYKIVVVWNVERMNVQASNTILKILEEPFPNTVFIFTTEHRDKILPTILSRVQQINLNKLDDSIIEQEVRKLHPDFSDSDVKREVMLSEGNLINIQASNMERMQEYFQLFIEVNKLAFGFRKDIASIIDFVGRFGKFNKEKQKHFLSYYLKTIDKCWQYNLGIPMIQHPLEMANDKFKSNFPKFITIHNLEGIFSVMEKAQKNIDSNANANINLTNMIIKLGMQFEKR